MVYQRSNRDGYVREYSFQARTRTGYEQRGTGTRDRILAARIETMWKELAERERAWDVLSKIRPLRKKPNPGTLTILELYDLWVEVKRNLPALRRRLADADIEPIVAEWNRWLRSQGGRDWAQHALSHVRRIVPEGRPLLASGVTDTWLTTELARIPLKRNTVRKVHSSWSSFFGYCTTVRKAFDVNPMEKVTRPGREKRPPMFYDGVTAERIVAWQPTPPRRAFFALVYGTSADVSPALAVERSDINPATREVRIAGTKYKTRDRVIRMADWAWEIFWNYSRSILHGRIFPATWNRWTVSDWHRQTVGKGTSDTRGTITQKGLELSQRLPLRMARHHYAVRMLSAGTPARVVAEALGSDEKTVLEYYGPFVPSGADRAKWERVASRHERARRKAQTP